MKRAFFAAISLFLCIPFTACASFDSIEWVPLRSLNLQPEGATINAVVTNGAYIYVGGNFTTIGGVEAKCVARWNGTAWEALGSGLEGRYYQDMNNTWETTSANVKALVRDGSGNIYAGGSFGRAGGIETWGVAKWNGSSWSALPGRGFPYRWYGNWVPCDYQNVECLQMLGNDLYVGGMLFKAGDFVGVTNVARLSNSGWQGVGSGLGRGSAERVFSLGAYGSTIIAGGNFQTNGARTAACRRLAQWNPDTPATDWQSFAGGVDDIPYSILSDGNDLIVGGKFTSVGNAASPVAANRIARYNGTLSQWQPMSEGVSNGDVLALARHSDGRIFAGGTFTNANGLVVRGVAQWVGSLWLPMGEGMSDANVRALAIDASGAVLAAGGFRTAGGIPVGGMAKFDRYWAPVCVPPSKGAVVNAILPDPDHGVVYVGGEFSSIGGTPANSIAKWDGARWESVGSGLQINTGGVLTQGVVNALAFDDRGRLVVGGRFNRAGGRTAHALAMWYRTNWYEAASGVLAPVMRVAGLATSTVHSLTWYPPAGCFYVSGDLPNPYLKDIFKFYSSSNAFNVLGVTEYDGYRQVGLNYNIGGPIRASGINPSDGYLYIGGELTQLSSFYGRDGNFDPSLELIRMVGFDHNQWGKWYPLRGASPAGGFYAITFDAQGNLFFGSKNGPGVGKATRVGRLDEPLVTNIGTFDVYSTNWPYEHSAWSALGGGVSNASGDTYVKALTFDGEGALLAGGSFTHAGTNRAGSVARWNGSTWSRVGTNTASKDVRSMAFDLKGRLLVGGAFDAGWQAANSSDTNNFSDGIVMTVYLGPKLDVLGTNSEVIVSGERISVEKGSDFEDVMPIGSSLSRTFRLMNLGTEHLTLSNAVFSGPGAASFAVAGMPSTIGYNTISNIVITFTPPSAPGVYEAALTIRSTAGADYVVQVRGSAGNRYIKTTQNTVLGTITPDGNVPVCAGSNQTFTMFSTNNLLPYVRLDGSDRGILYAHTYTNVTHNNHRLHVDFNVDTVISGVVVTQRSLRSASKYVDIRYNLGDADNTRLDVSVAISTNGGFSFDVPLRSCSGDIGHGITPGNGKHIIWLAHEDWDGQYSDAVVMRLVATDDNGDAVGETDVMTLDTEFGVRPRVLEIRGLDRDGSDYFNSSTPATFLDDIGRLYGAGDEFKVPCLAVVDWKGTGEGTVKWLVNNRQMSVGPASTEYLLSVSDGVGPGGKLEVIATGNNQGKSAAVRANMEVVEPPKLWTRYTASAPYAGRKSYDFLSPNVSFSKKSSETIPSKTPSGKDTPGAGNNKFENPLTLSISGSVDLEGAGRLGASMSREWDVKGITVKPIVGGGVDFDYLYERSAWDYGGYFSVGVDVSKETEPRYITFKPPLYGKIGAHLEVIGTVYFDSDINPEWGSSQIQITPGFWGTLGFGIAGLANIEGLVGLDLPNTFQIEPFEYDLDLALRAEISANLLFWSTTIWSERWNYDIYSTGSRSSSSANTISRTLTELKPQEFKLMSRDYLYVQKGGRELNNKVLGRDGVELVLPLKQSRALTPSAGELFVQADGFPYSEPALDVRGTNRMLLWVKDAGTNRLAQNANALNWSVWNGSDWVDQGLLWDEGTGDSRPQLGLLANGTAIAAWQNAGNVLSPTSGLDEALSSLEIAVARYNGTNWLSFNLTTNSVMDRAPQLSVAANGTALLTWQQNSGTLDPDSLVMNQVDSLYASFWNGTQWSIPQLVAQNAGLILGTSLAWNGYTGYLFVAIDADQDLTTDTDQDLYSSTFFSGSWAALTRRTSNNIQDTRPQVVFDSNGNLLVAWYQNGKVYSSTTLQLSNPALVGNIQKTSAAQDFRLVTGQRGEISVVWSDTIEAPFFQNPHLFHFDRTFNCWSKPVPLLTDSAIERSYSGKFATNGAIVLAYNKVEVHLNDANMATNVGPVTALATLEYRPGVDGAIFARYIVLNSTVVTPGSNITGYAIFRNIGELAGGNMWGDVYLGNPMAGGVRISHSALGTNGFFLAGDSNTVTFSWTVPTNGVAQAIYARLTAGDFNDRDIRNNQAYISPMLPDYELVHLRSEQLSTDERLLSFEVRNTGALVAPTNTVVLRAESTNGPVLAMFPFGPLDQGLRYTNSYLWNMTGAGLTSAFIQVFAVVDVDGAVSEASEENNSIRKRVNSNLDADGDKLLDGDEARYGTDPNEDDTDNDGLTDYDEITVYGSNPLDADSDQDGLLDGGEIARSTDPRDADSDDDGFADGVEVSKGTDPLNPASYPSGMVGLVVRGQPSEYGLARPNGYGTNYYDSGVVVTSQVEQYVGVASGDRQVCTGWTGSGSVQASGSGTQVVFTISNASTVTWHFAQQYELALDTVSDGTTSGMPGSITGSSTGWYASGSSITLTAAPLPEFRFAGWFGDVPTAMTNQNPLTLSMSQRRTIFARFARKQYTLEVVSARGSPTPRGILSYPHGEILDPSVNSPIIVGGTQYECTGWTLGGHEPSSGTDTTFTVTLTNNAVLSWLWRTNALLTAYAGAGGALSGSESGWYPLGSNVSLEATPNSNWRFVQWAGDVPPASMTNTPLDIAMSQGRTITAVFTNPLVYVHVAASPWNGGMASRSVTCHVGENIPLTATPSTNWLFSAWNDGDTNSVRTIVAPMTSVMYTATFVPMMRTVTVQANPSDAGTGAGGGSFQAGSNIVISATAAVNWVFTHWNDGVTNRIRTIAVPQTNITFTANYRSNAVLSVQADPVEGGTVAGGGIYLAGSNIVISATAAVNWVFTGWNDGLTSRVRTVTMPLTNIIFTANFRSNAVLSVQADPADGGGVTGGGVFEAGTRVSISATTAVNWVFTGWNDGDSNLTRTVTMPETNITYRASFLRNSPAYWYVATNGDDSAAGTNWASAKLTLQAAADVSRDGDIIEVNNGVYASGGRPMAGSALTNRVALTNAVTVRSLNGAGVTVIRGEPGVRGAYLGAGAVLAGFTITNGATLMAGASDDLNGGGVWAAGSAVISNSFLAANTASAFGGGVFGGRLVNCMVFSNSAVQGGGAFGAALVNCTVTENAATEGGGAHSSTGLNTIVYYNAAASSSNAHGSSFDYSCVAPLPAGTGNTADSPLFFRPSRGNYRLGTLSPCLNTGDNAAAQGEKDLQGAARIQGGTVDMGAYEGGIVISTPEASYAGSAIAFDGVNDHLTAANSSSVSRGGDFTIEAWIRVPDRSATYQIITKQPTVAVNEFPGNYEFRVDQGSGRLTLGFEYGQWVGAIAFWSSTASVPVGQYAHVAVVYRAGSSVQFFINGVPDTLYRTGYVPEQNGQPVRIGARKDGYHFKGQMDEVRLWSVPRSSTEIAALYRNRLNGSETGLAAYWRMDDGVGGTVVDSSGNANTATLQNGATFVRSDAGIQHVSVLTTNAVVITLSGFESGFPANELLANITTLPALGTLRQYGSLDPIASVPTLVTDPARRLVYQPPVETEDADVFVYQVTDGDFDSLNTATVAVDVANSTYIPLANNPGAALRFNGSGSYITVPDSGWLDLPDTFTLEAWVKVDHYNQWCPIIAKQGGTSPGNYEFRIDQGTGRLTFGFQSGSFPTERPFYTSEGSVPTGQWTHVAMTFNKGIGVVLYINGRPDSGGDFEGYGLFAAQANANSLLIGGRDDGLRFAGEMDEVRVWSRTLSEAELGSGFRTRLIGDENGLAAYWPMDDGVGTDIADATGHGNGGTIMNGAQFVLSGAPVDRVHVATTNDVTILLSGYKTNSALNGLTNTILSLPLAGTLRQYGTLEPITNVPAQVMDSQRRVIYSPPLTNAVYPFSYQVSDGVNASPNAAVVRIQVTLFPTDRYVNSSNTTPAEPYTTWETAATNIQQAVDVAMDGDTIHVAPGVYDQEPGRKIPGYRLTNCVYVSKSVVLSGEAGPEATIINGRGMRCVFLDNNAVLDGFTLTGGNVLYGQDVLASDQRSSGVLSRNSATVTNCIISGNTGSYGGGAGYVTLNNCRLVGNYAGQYGGGAYRATLNSCTLSGNTAARDGGGAIECTLNNSLLVGNHADWSAGGALGGTLNNCTIVSNTAGANAGVYIATLNNSICYYNTVAGAVNNHLSSSFHHSCTTPHPGGTGNVTNEPMFKSLATGDFNLSDGSACLNAGDNTYATNFPSDFAGNPRVQADVVDMGALESPAVKITVVANPPSGGAVSGIGSYTPGVSHPISAIVTSFWNFVNWSHGATDPSTTITVPATNTTYTANFVRPDVVWHVAPNGSDSAVGTNWATAKQTLQAAVDAALSSDSVLVTNGVYASGGAGMASINNRVVINKPITVRSVNGPGVTTIQGGGMGFRGAYVGDGAALDGFTVTGGSSFYFDGGGEWDRNDGGGIFASAAGVIRNCVISGNHAARFGGGVFGGILQNCTVSNNSVFTAGGGVAFSTLENCLVSGNSGWGDGAGAINSILRNCTVVNNAQTVDYAPGCGGVANCSNYNTVVYFNTAVLGDANHKGSFFDSSCTVPTPGGTGNITNDPQFMNVSAQDYRLTALSPCRNAGNNANVILSADLLSMPRIVDGVVDMGAYEVQTQALVTVWANPTQGGTVSGGGYYPVGSNAVVSATPNSGWTFVDWSDGETSTVRNIVVPGTNLNFTANFSTLINVSGVAIPEGSGTFVGEGTVVSGSTNALTAVPEPSWIFVKWSTGETNGTMTFVASYSDTVYRAHFARVTPSSGPLAGGHAVTVTNGYFGQITNVLLGSSSASIQASGSNWVRFVAPALASTGTVHVTIQTSDNGQTLIRDAYTVNPAGRIHGPTMARPTHGNLDAGSSFSVALRADGSASTWGGFEGGYNFGQLNVPSPNEQFVDVGAGWWFSAYVRSNGMISAVGRNVNGECNVPALNEGFVAVDCGDMHSVALKADGTLAGWGWNYYGPGNVPAPNEGFVAIAAGDYHSLGVKTNGSVVAWGDNGSGQCNLPSPNSDFVAVAGGQAFSVGLKSNGTVVAWGSMGVPSPNSDIVAIAARKSHAAALRADGSIVCWGDNSYGQCNVPAPNEGFVDVSCGTWHTVGLKEDGTIVVWGRNNYGQLSVAQPNEDYGLGAYGVAPRMGLALGGYEVVIHGSNLGDGTDVTQVSLAGIPVQQIVSQSSTQVVVIAGAAPDAVTGNVQIVSSHFGTTVRTNGFTYTIQIPQEITFPAMADQIATSRVALNATASSGLTVYYSVASGPAFISGGSTLVFTGAGRVQVVASQPGNAMWMSAFDVARSVTVYPAAATITLSDLDQTFNGDPRVALHTTDPAGLETEVQYDGLPDAPTAVGSYEVTAAIRDPLYKGSATGTLVVAKAAAAVYLDGLSQVYNGSVRSVTATTMPAGLTVEVAYAGGVQPMNVGSYGVTGTVHDLNYQGSVTGTLSILSATQSIVFEMPTNQLTTHITPLNASAPSGLPVSFTLVSGPAQLESATSPSHMTYTGPGEVVVSASQAGDSQWQPATTVARTVTVVRAVATLALSPLRQAYDGSPRAVLATTVPNGLAVDITYEGGPVPPTDPGVYMVTGIVNDVMYQQEVQNLLTITKETATVHLSGLSQLYDGTPRTVTATTMPAGLVVSITYDGANEAPVTGGTYHVVAEVHDDNYDGSATDTLVVQPAAQTITFPAIPMQVATNVAFLAATASSGLPIVYDVLSGPGVLATVTSLTFNGSGEVALRASQPGNASWQAAPPMTNLFTVEKAVAVVTLTNLVHTYDGNPKSPDEQTDPPGLTVVLTYNGSATAPSNAGSYAVTGTINEVIWQGETTGTLTIAQLSQTISGFGAIPPQREDVTNALAATATSGLPVTFAVVDGPGSLIGPIDLIYSAPGDVVVVASQTGSVNWASAPAVTNTVKVFRTTPWHGPLAGGNPVTVTNGLLGTITNVIVESGTGVEPVTSGVSWVSMVMPPATNAGPVTFLVQTATNGTYTLTNAYRYNPAGTISSVSPAEGFWTGGVQVVISGTDLSDASDLSDLSDVTLAGVSAASILSHSATQVVVVAGASSAGVLGDVRVFSISHGETVSTNAFTYRLPQFAILGTNGAVIASSTGVSPVNGTAFGEAIIGLDSITNTFTITNAGNATLTMETYGTNGTHAGSFLLVDVPATLPAGTSAVFSVVFEPQVGGSNMASFVFSFDGTNSPYTVNVAGVGLGGGIALETNAFAFAGTFAGANPPVQLLGMTNVGVSGFTWTNTIAYGVGASNWLSVLPGAGTVPLAGAIDLTNAVDIAGISVGSYTATVTIAAGDATNSPQAYAMVLTVGRATQTITFANPGAQVTTNETAISATSDSGLPVTFAVVSGAATLSTNTSPATVTYSGAGEVVLTAEQAGSLNYEPAPTVTNTFTVSLTAQSALVFAPATPQTYNTTNGLSTTGGSGTGAVSYAVLIGPGAITNGTGLVATSGTGEIVVEATKVADSLYALQTASATVTVQKATQTITFGNPGMQFWTNTTPISATSSSGLDVIFAVVSGPAMLGNGTNGTYATYGGYGTVVLTADQAGGDNYEPAPTVTNSFDVVGPQFVFLGTNGAVVESGAGVSPAAGTDFGEAIIGGTSLTNVFAITNAGSALLTLGTYGTNGTHGTSFQLLDVPATLAVGAVTNVTIVFAPQVGGSNTASFVFSFDGTNSPYTVNVAGVGLGGGIALETNALAFTGTFAGMNPPAQFLGMTNVGVSGFTWTNTIAYSAGASNWLSVLPDNGTLQLRSAAVLTNVVDLVGVGAGIHTARVTIAAVDATNSPQAYAVVLTVGRAAQTITFANPGQQIVTNETPLTATASSGLPVTLSVVSGAAVLVNGTNGTVATYGVPGLVTLRASQAGDADWQAAGAVEVSFRVRADRVPYADFDGDGRSDLTVYWPLSGTWFHWLSGADEYLERRWGWSAVTPVPADYDGDGIVDLAVYHRATGEWYIYSSLEKKLIQRQFGWFATEAVPGDYDGDGITDFAVHNRADGKWYIIRHDWTGYRELSFGWRETVPVPADYDGDGITDIAVYWPKQGRWHVVRSSDGRYVERGWGWSAALPVPADYDGDGLADVAVFWPQAGTWYILKSSVNKLREQHFGWYRCVPVPGDFDGDGIDDVAVYEPLEGRWSILHAPGRFTTRLFGWSETLPPWPSRR